MATRMSYYCDRCHAHINARDNPIVIYVVAGHVNGGGEIDEATLHPWVRALLKQDTARKEYCPPCFDEAMHDAFRETHHQGGGLDFDGDPATRDPGSLLPDRG